LFPHGDTERKKGGDGFKQNVIPGHRKLGRLKTGPHQRPTENVPSHREKKAGMVARELQKPRKKILDFRRHMTREVKNKTKNTPRVSHTGKM